MNLNEIPLAFALIGLTLYTVLGGADFGAGFWQLTAGGGEHGKRIRDHALHAIGPVWEANHVWLIFVLTVVWTSYPTAFGSIASTLSVPLLIAAVGIVLRGTAYAVHAATTKPREHRVIDTVFSLSSILTPFALGAMVGGIASRRVPVGNAAGNLFSTWLNPTSILVGVLAVAVGAFLSAVFLSAESVRLGVPDLERWFRLRALGAGVVAGVIALGGLLVLHADARPLYHGLLEGAGLPAVLVSALAGVTTLLLVWVRRFEPARYTAGLAVAAIVLGWTIAQRPVLLPGLTVAQAAAPHDTLVAVVVAVLAGAVILFPSLALLFGLILRGGFDPTHPSEPRGRRGAAMGAEQGRRGAAMGATQAAPAVPARRVILSASRPRLLARSAGGCLIVGTGLLNIADASWAHALGVVALLGFVILTFLAVAPADIADTT